MRKWIDYDEYLKSDVWQIRRAMALERAGYKCHVCGERENLNVHHKTYEHLGNELPEELVVLCRTHHWMEHNPGEIVPVDINKKKTKSPRKINTESKCKYFAHVLRKMDGIVSSCDQSNMPLDKLRKLLDWEARLESHQNRCPICNPDVLECTLEERQEMRAAHKKERKTRRKNWRREQKRKERAEKKAEIKSAKTGILCPYAVGITRKIEKLAGNYDDKFRLCQEDRDKQRDLEAALKKHIAKCDKCRQSAKQLA